MNLWVNTFLLVIIFIIFHYFSFKKSDRPVIYLPNSMMLFLLILQIGLFIAYFKQHSFNHTLFPIMLITVSGIFFTFSDSYYLMISPIIYYASVFFSIIYHLYDYGFQINLTVSQIILIVFLIIIHTFLSDWIGQGDIKLLIWWSCYFSPLEIYSILFIASFVGICYGLIIKHYFKRNILPFIPALVTGLLIYINFCS